MRKSLILLAALAFLAGCKTDLYSNISEREVNEMMGVLMQNGITATKVSVSDGLFSLQVDSSEISAALAILDAQGLPRGSRQSIGEVFQRSGMISSPFEERIRYIYALGEEVAQTIQQIDGVLVARVHIVMPEDPPLGQPPRPSSAAVFIRQRAGFDLEFLTPQIRRLVSSSIEGVDYESVTVVLVEAQPSQPLVSPSEDLRTVLPGLQLHAASVTTFWTVVGGLAAACAVFLGTTVFVALRGRMRRRKTEDGAEELA